MRKLILKYWITNVLFSLTLFAVHRILIADKEYSNANWLDFFFSLTEIFVNLGLSLIFLVLFPVCSLTFFLNLMIRVRNQYYLSLLTFIIVPLAFSVYILTAFIDTFSSGNSVFETILILLLIYLTFNCIQFRMFRQRMLSLTTVSKE